MACSFFGHHSITQDIEEKLNASITTLISEGIHTFYVGNNGQFDLIVQEALRKKQMEFPHLKYRIILSRIDEKAISGEQKATVFPEELATALPRFAICKRNEWLIKNSSVIICYISRNPSNSQKWVDKACKKGLKIINLADDVSFNRI